MIQEVLDHYGVSTRGGGSNKTMQCPVHDDRQASATVDLDKDVWFCHACGVGGSGYDLVMRREGIDFAAAKRFCEEKLGVVGDSSRGKPRERTRVPLGSGYSPRYRRKVSSGSRQRIKYT
jgi:DNA primase